MRRHPAHRSGHNRAAYQPPFDEILGCHQEVERHRRPSTPQPFLSLLLHATINPPSLTSRRKGPAMKTQYYTAIVSMASSQRQMIHRHGCFLSRYQRHQLSRVYQTCRRSWAHDPCMDRTPRRQAARRLGRHTSRHGFSPGASCRAWQAQTCGLCKAMCVPSMPTCAPPRTGRISGWSVVAS